MNELSQYVNLPQDLGEPTSGEVSDRPSVVLVTGATGYLGAWLVCSLLEDPAATVICLVRATSPEDAFARVARNLAHYSLAADLTRVQALPCTLEQPDLGLDTPTWQALARDVDSIIHAAANVNFMTPLDRLLPANVDSAVNLLRLAGHTRPKTLHLASSYSVFNEAAFAGASVATEAPLPGTGAGFRNAYPMSKWIAERVTDLARERGWNVATHRLGLLWGDARTGRCKSDDALALSIRACLTLGRAYDSDFLMHVTPVDFAAAAMARLALSPATADHYFHEITETPITWGDFIRTLQRQGHEIEFVSRAEWHTALRQSLPAHREFSPLLLLDGLGASNQAPNVAHMRFDASKLRAALTGSGINCPPINDALIRTWVNAIQTS